jgi:hypothetical protein
MQPSGLQRSITPQVVENRQSTDFDAAQGAVQMHIGTDKLADLPSPRRRRQCLDLPHAPRSRQIPIEPAETPTVPSAISFIDACPTPAGGARPVPHPQRIGVRLTCTKATAIKCNNSPLRTLGLASAADVLQISSRNGANVLLSFASQKLQQFRPLGHSCKTYEFCKTVRCIRLSYETIKV